MDDQFSAFLLEAALAYYYHSDIELRFGQALFNTLDVFDSDLAESIRCTDLDPFHDDGRIPKFLTRVRDEWQILATELEQNHAE
jgi:hypothetical protein